MSESVKNSLEVEYMRFMDLKCKNMNRNAAKCFLRLLVEPFLGGSRRVGNEGVKLGLEEGELGETCSQFFFCFSLSYFIF